MWLGGKALVVAGFAAAFVAVSLLTRAIARWIPDGPLKRVLYREENQPPAVPGSPEHLEEARAVTRLSRAFYVALPALILVVYWIAGGSFTAPF